MLSDIDNKTLQNGDKKIVFYSMNEILLETRSGSNFPYVSIMSRQ